MSIVLPLQQKQKKPQQQFCGIAVTEVSLCHRVQVTVLINSVVFFSRSEAEEGGERELQLPSANTRPSSFALRLHTDPVVEGTGRDAASV